MTQFTRMTETIILRLSEGVQEFSGGMVRNKSVYLQEHQRTPYEWLSVWGLQTLAPLVPLGRQILRQMGPIDSAILQSQTQFEPRLSSYQIEVAGSGLCWSVPG